MMKPMTKKLLLGIPTVALSAVLACTLAGCGGNAPSGSGGSAPVQEKSKKAKALICLEERLSVDMRGYLSAK